MRQKVDSYGELEKYVDENTRQSLLANVNEVVEWLYDDASKAATKADLEQKLFVFRAIGEPIKARKNYYSELDVYFKQFEKISENIQVQFDKMPFLSD